MKRSKYVARIFYGLGIAWIAGLSSFPDSTLRLVVTFVGGMAIGFGATGWED